MNPLSEDQLALLDADGHILALGGPGSGKTTTALLKTEREIKSCKLKRGQRILFLSFARATIARIAQQASKVLSRSGQDVLEINTYHGFAWSLLRSHGYLLLSGSKIRLLPPPEAASRLAEVPSHQRDGEKQRLFDTEGLLHFDLFAGLAADLLSKCDKLTRIICDTYPTIILDEFQDTDSHEWRMIRTLGNRSRLIALADAEQRIYEFRGADPKRIGEFISAYSPRQFDFGLANHRSAGTDIVAFGNDLLTGANKSASYKDVTVLRYGYYGGRSSHYAFKGALIQGIRRQVKAARPSWSIAVLVPSRRMMLAVSDYLATTADGLPEVYHDVAMDAEGPSLAATLIAGLLDGGRGATELSRRFLVDLCNYLRGRKGNDSPTQADLKITVAIGTYLEKGTIRGKNRQQIIDESVRIAEARGQLRFSGDAGEDWLAVRRLLAESESEVIRDCADDAKYLRLLNKGAALRAKLGTIWRTNGQYAGAAQAVQEALVQEHFSASTKEWKGVNVMTIHKSKGKEFDEVFVYEGSHQGRIVRANSTEKDLAQACLTLRVAVTRARMRATILTPKDKVCEFL